nr:MAG TPA: hypothetical protein [Caudoviricetes sp.]
MEDTHQPNKIELHYWIRNDSHTMDAFTLNRCEWELLNLFEEISKETKFKISIEAEAITEGGIRQWFNIISKEEDKKASISKTIFITVLTLALSKPLEIGFEILKDYLSNDKEMIELEKEEKKLRIKGIKLDNEIKEKELKQISSPQNDKIEYLQTSLTSQIKQLNTTTDYLQLFVSKQSGELETMKSVIKEMSNNTKIKKRTSNFYEELSKEPKVCKISINSYGSDNTRLHPELVIDKPEFSNFILSTNELETLIDENAIIEIVSPVLKKGNYQWRGIYNGEILNFNMKSNEFKTLVQAGKVEFKSGTSIKCILEMPRVMNNLGEELISSYNITKVIGFYNGINYNETDEGRKYNRKKQADEAQLDLFSDMQNKNKE